MIQYFKNIENSTVAIKKPEDGSWVNVLPPLKQEEFAELSEALGIPLDFLKDSLDIDERSRYETDEGVKLIVIKTPTENNSFNDSDALYITIPICIIITQHHIVTVNSFENEAIKKFLNSFQNRSADKKNMMVLKIFEKVTANFQEYLKEIHQRRNQLEQKLYHSNRNAELLELVKVQKSLVYFVTALRSNELLMMKLARTDILQLDEDEKEFLEDLIVETSQSLEMANTYTHILVSSLDALGSIVSNNMNNVLKWLTSVIIIISLPLLVITIFGLHVTVSGPQELRAVNIAVIISLLISVGISIYFMKKKWF